MTPGAERLLLLSLRLLKTAANNRMSDEVKGRVLQRIAETLTETLPQLSFESSPADEARVALAGYFRKMAAAQTQANF